MTPTEVDPIGDDELLYRRVPVSTGWYSQGGLSPEAFNPRKGFDTSGISMSRAKHTSLEDAAKGTSKQGYYIVILRAGDLRKHGFRVDSRPTPDDPGHAELPDLNDTSLNTNQAREMMLVLSKLSLKIEGPFLPG